ncbi:MAG: DUF4340 domain-containing protein [bacterium]
MKRFKSTIITFIIFVGLAGYYFLIENKKTNETEEKKLYIFNFEKDDFKTLELIDMSDMSSFLLEKGKNWQSGDTADEIISELAKLSADRDVTKDVRDLKHYGLSIPKYKVKFDVGSESHTLYIGNKNPTEDFYFVKEEGKDRIYTVDVDSINKFIRLGTLVVIPSEARNLL